MPANPVYQAFDRWLQSPSWYSVHPTDLRAFDNAISEVALDPHFTLDGLRDYIMSRDWGEAIGMPLTKKEKRAKCDRYIEIAAEFLDGCKHLRRD